MSSRQNEKKSEAAEVRVRAVGIMADELKSHGFTFDNTTVTRSAIKDAPPQEFQLDAVFAEDVAPAALYEETLAALVPQVARGFTVTLFSTGEVSADGEMPAQLVAMAAKQLFALVEKSEEFSVRVSQLEVTGNEQLVDLLSDDERSLRLFDHPKEGVTVHNLESFPCGDVAAVESQFARGAAKHSNDGHRVFTITVNVKENGEEGEEQLSVGKLNLVTMGNNNTLQLGRVISALLSGRHVPYRESKLTRLLQESLGGSHKTCVIANITAANFESMLDFATHAKAVRNKPRINSRIRKRAMVRELMGEIEQLKAALLYSREQNGVYIPPEQWADVQKEHADTRERLEATERDLQTRIAQLEQLHTQFEESQRTLHQTADELSQTQTTLSQTQETLRNTQDTLTSTEQTLEEKMEIINVREAVESVLHSNASRVLGALEEREVEVEQLHAKLAREAHTTEANNSTAEAARIQVSDAVYAMGESLEAFRAQQNDRYGELRGDINDFLARKNVELQQLCSSLESLESAINRSASALKADASESQSSNTHGVEEVVAAAAEEREQVETCVQNYLANAQESLETFRAALQEEREQLARWTTEAIEQMTENSQQQSEWFRGHIGALQELSTTLVSHTNANKAWVEQHQESIKSATEQQREQTEAGAAELMQSIQALIGSFVNEVVNERAQFTEQTVHSIEQLDATLKEQAEANSTTIVQHFVPSVQEQAEQQASAHQIMVNVVETRTAHVQKRIAEDEARVDDWLERDTQFASSTEDLQGDGTRQVDTAAAEARQQIKDASAALTAALGELVMDVAEWKDTAAESALTAQAHTETTVDGVSERLAASNKEVNRWSENTVASLNDVGNSWDRYFADIRQVEITGSTPVKRAIPYPSELPTTKPNEEIIAEYWNTHRKELGNEPLTPTSVNSVINPPTVIMEEKTKSCTAEEEQEQQQVADEHTPEFVADPAELMAALEASQQKEQQQPTKEKKTSSKARKMGSRQASKEGMKGQSLAARRAQKRKVLAAANKK